MYSTTLQVRSFELSTAVSRHFFLERNIIVKKKSALPLENSSFFFVSLEVCLWDDRDSNPSCPLRIQSHVSYWPHPRSPASRSLCRHRLPTTSGFFSGSRHRSQINSPLLSDSKSRYVLLHTLTLSKEKKEVWPESV